MKSKKSIFVIAIFLIMLAIGLIFLIKGGNKTLEGKIKNIEKNSIKWGEKNPKELNYKCEVEGTIYEKCAILSIKNLLEKNIIKEDKVDENGSKVLENPKTKETLNNKYVAIYLKNGKTQAKYNILDGEAHLITRENESSRENYYIFMNYISEVNFVNYIDAKYKNKDCKKLENAWCVADETKENSKSSDIIAWVEKSDDELYKLYIGSNKRIYAPVFSAYLFSNFKELKTINFINFDTSKTLDMHWMFLNDAKLEKLDLNNFDTTSVECLSFMFGACSNLKELDLSNFYTPKLRIITGMFSNCENLEKINLSNFKLNEVTEKNIVFFNNKKLSEIKIKDKNATDILKELTEKDVKFSK